MKMKKLLVLVAIVLLASSGIAAQTTQQSSSAKASAEADAKASAKADAKNKQQPAEATIDAGSQIQAEMASTLDLKKAKPGDKFKMKTTRPVKRDGKEVISKGSTLTGHVEQVTRADNTTKALLVFDEIQDKKTGSVASLDAVVTAVTRAQQNVSAMTDDDMMARPMPRTQPSGGQSGGGGLLGGVVNTVGGVTGQVGATVDATTRGTVGGGTGLGNTVGGLAGGTIQIVNDTTTGATSGSTLALTDRNLKIESGTQFLLQTTSSLVFTGEKKEKEKK